MDDKAHQSMLCPDYRDLLSPKTGRIVAQDMKKRVILSRGYRKFDNIADKERKNRATTASLWIQVRHIRDRHIVREIQRIKPINIPIEYG